MLKKVGTNWSFENEAVLEDFCWNNLESLLGVIPIARQFNTTSKYVCDILAKTRYNQLVILELKNEEDRYIIQQLTRYYDQLVIEKVFEAEIDYQLPVKLVAVAPVFHRDNLTDIKYHKLDFELLQFKVIEQQDIVYFQISKLVNSSQCQIRIPYQRQDKNIDVIEPPRSLLNILNKYDLEEKNNILSIRAKILGSDNQIQEIIDSGKFLYGKSKNSVFAELRHDPQRNSLALFLWLANTHAKNKKHFRARMRVWNDWINVTDIAHVPKGLGRTITKQEWKSGKIKPLKKLQPRQNSWIKKLNENPSPRKRYEQNLIKRIDNHHIMVIVDEY